MRLSGDPEAPLAAAPPGPGGAVTTASN